MKHGTWEGWTKPPVSPKPENTKYKGARKSVIQSGCQSAGGVPAGAWLHAPYNTVTGKAGSDS